MGSIFRPDLKAGVWLLVGMFVAPKVISFVRGKL